MTQFSYQVLFDPSAGTPTDITDFAERVEWNEVGTGEVRSATIRLNAQDGQFITRAVSFAGEQTPILKQFDQISIGAVDRDGRNKLNVFEVDILKPIQNAQQGAILEVQLLGLENQLMKVNFAKPFRLQGGASGFIVARDIIDFYNDGNSKGGLQPFVIGNKNNFNASIGGILGFNELPTWTAGEFHFELTEQSAYDGVNIVGDEMGSSVVTGGAGDFFEIYFETDLANAQQLLFKAFISGNPPTQQTDPANLDQTFDFTKAITIDDTLAVNPGEEEGGIESIHGNVTGTWGADGLGTLPRTNARFQGALEAYLSFTPFGTDNTFYPQDSIVQVTRNGVDNMLEHYVADQDTTNNPETNTTDWTLITFEDYLGLKDVPLNYTAWTQGLANAWKNNGAHVDGSVGDDPPVLGNDDGSLGSVSIWDSNLVILDGTFSRTWAHVKSIDSTQIRSQFLYGGQFFYRGFRVLINGTPPDTPGNVFFGRGFENKVVQNTGSDFVIFREPGTNGQCAVDETARTYTFDGANWAINTENRGNDCYHPLFQIGTDQGHNNTLRGDGVGNFGQFSAVTYEYRWEKSDAIKVFNNDPSYYRITIGANWQTPFPPNSFNSQVIGQQYGSDPNVREPTTIDVTNMHFSSNSKIGFNHSFAEDLGPLDSISTFVKHLWKYNKDGSGKIVLAGNFAYRCVMYDTSDNVVTQDFNIPFNGEWTQISLPIGNFKIYRGRKGVTWDSFVSTLFLQDREILQVFEFHNIMKIGIHWLGAYDDNGRYNVWSIGDVIFDDPAGLGVNGYNVKLTVDSWEWSEVGLAISPPNTNDRAIQPRFFDEPLITNFLQLQQANIAHLDRQNFQEKRFDVVTEGLFDINFGDSYFLENEFIVNDADKPDGGVGFVPNTIKLVAKKINYVIDKRPDVPGGFLRTIEGAKRLEGET